MASATRLYTPDILALAVELADFPQILQIHVTMIQLGMNGGKIRLRLAGLTLF